MIEIDSQKFGALVAARRKELQLTQKQLAEKLNVTDKAVSKWERGLSLPDIGLLTPLAEALGLTVAELLRGERMPPETALPLYEVEDLLAVQQRQAERQAQEKAARRVWLHRWCLCLCWALVSGAASRVLAGATLWETFADCGGAPLTLTLLSAVLCLAACFTQERLPDYYDENVITSYDNGFFRLKLGVIRISNANWPAIKRTMFWSLAVLWVSTLPVHTLLLQCFPRWYGQYFLAIALVMQLGGLFVPVVAAAWKYRQKPEVV